MATKRVVTRKSRATDGDNKRFRFSRESIPSQIKIDETTEKLANYRLQAWDVFEQIPMPTRGDEAWRRTDLSPLPASTFRLHSDPIFIKANLDKIPSELLKPLAGQAHGGQIILGVNGGQQELSETLISKGVIFTDLANAEIHFPEILARILGTIVRPSEGKFAAMAASLARLGVLVYVPRGVHVEQPLHSVLWGAGIDVAFLSHIIIWLEEGASLTYVHEAASHTEIDGQALHAGIVEIYVGQSANLRFVELQSWGEHVWNFSHERARIDCDGNLDWIFGSVGSKVTKIFSDLDLVGRGANGRMSGFYFTNGDQHLDQDTQQNHLAPHTTSDLLFKGALKERSRSVWQGMIYVAPGAQKADGYQANRNLILSPLARADSIPGLEILADDVRCTHGATVGKIDADQVFYLRSRGIKYPDAERLIVEGFFDPIMQRIPFERIRTRFQDAIIDKMG